MCLRLILSRSHTLSPCSYRYACTLLTSVAAIMWVSVSMCLVWWYQIYKDKKSIQRKRSVCMTAHLNIKRLLLPLCFGRIFWGRAYSYIKCNGFGVLGALGVVYFVFALFFFLFWFGWAKFYDTIDNKAIKFAQWDKYAECDSMESRVLPQL